MVKTGLYHYIKRDYMATTFRGITYGTFDLLHIGHIKLLKRIKNRVDYLVVGLSTDKFNHLKGKVSAQSYKERKEILESIKYVDKVIPEKNWEQKQTDKKKYKIDKFYMGDDWKGEFEGCIYLPRTKGISSTKLRKQYGIT